MDKQNTTTTKHKIGTTTYFVVASPSDKATDTIKTKVEKLILKDMSRDNINQTLTI